MQMFVWVVLSWHGVDRVRSNAAGVGLDIELVHERLQRLVRLCYRREWDGCISVNQGGPLGVGPD